MLNENGVVIDDGTAARSVASTSSSRRRAAASRIAAWLEEWRQCERPDFEVFVSPGTTAATATAAPRPPAARALRTDIAFDWRSMPHMSLREGRFAGVPRALYRVSFGRAGYEINVPRYGAASRPNS